MAYFIFGYFSTKFGTYVDGHEETITWKFHWNHPQEINCRANTVQNLYHGKCTGKRDSALQNFLIRQNMCRNLKFLNAETLDIRKNKLFRNRPSNFCYTYPNICDRTKKCTIVDSFKNPHITNGLQHNNQVIHSLSS
jgi:hypothetical protein